MTQQHETQPRRSKFPQYIAPVIILLLAIGAAIYGVVRSTDESNTAPTEDTTTTEQQADDSEHLPEVENGFPEAAPAQQQALAAARTEMELYVLSEHQLGLVLSDPQFGYEFDQGAIDFAVDHLDVDWNDQAHQYALATLNESPEVERNALADLMQNDPAGPQFSAEQVDYAMSQLN